MKGWYCLYECSKNQWLTNNSYWLNDRDYYSQMVGTKHAIQTTSNYSYNPNLPQIEVIDVQSLPVLTEGANKVNPNDLMRFETITEAEEYLVKNFSADNGEFYSIRKIYF
jgi:hypothetical protein